jgi:hypothetical protein
MQASHFVLLNAFFECCCRSLVLQKLASFVDCQNAQLEGRVKGIIFFGAASYVVKYYCWTLVKMSLYHLCIPLSSPNDA